MANNPNVNKVVYGNQTVMDITDTTATEGDVANGAVFYKANGARSVGTATPSDPEWGDITGTLSDQTDLQTELDNKVITLTKAQYDALSTAEKNDPSKVYYVTDYDAPKTYVELDDSSISLDKVWSGQKIKDYADNAYTLPTASASVKGGIKVNDGAAGGVYMSGINDQYLNLRNATTTQKGGIYVGDGLKASSGVLSVRGLNGIYVDSDGVYLGGNFGSSTEIFTMRESRSVSNAVQRVNVSFNCTETYTEDYFKKHRISYLFLLPSSGSGSATAIVLSQSVGSSVVNLQTIAFREPDSPTSFTATRAQLWM